MNERSHQSTLAEVLHHEIEPFVSLCFNASVNEILGLLDIPILTMLLYLRVEGKKRHLIDTDLYCCIFGLE